MGFLSLSALFSFTALADEALPTSSGVTLTTSVDWQTRHQEALANAWLNEPELAEVAWSIAPRITRAGTPRLTYSELYLPALAPVFIERLLVQGESDGVRMALVEVLPRVGGEWSEPLISLMASEPSAVVRMTIAEVARKADPASARLLLELAVADTDPDVRAAAMRSIPYVEGGAGMEQHILAGMSDPDPIVRGFAARAAGWCGVGVAWGRLVELLADDDATSRLYALRALERIDASAARQLPQVTAMHADADARVARAARQISE